MAFTATFLLPSQLIKPLSHHLLHQQNNPCFKKKRSIVPVARLFGPAIFEASKLKVLFLGVDEKKHPGNLPRTYTLTHSDITSKLTLAISQTIDGSQMRLYFDLIQLCVLVLLGNKKQLQGWYNKLQRDEVVAEWKKLKGNMSLHVHCHISGGHFLLDLFARLRFYIFRKELPVVLKAFVHGDGNLFQNYPELEEALVWVYFHSNLHEFNKVECWGPLKDASAPSQGSNQIKTLDDVYDELSLVRPQPCKEDCTCCFPSTSLIPWSGQEFPDPSLNQNLQQP